MYYYASPQNRGSILTLFLAAKINDDNLTLSQPLNTIINANFSLPEKIINLTLSIPK